MPRKRISAEGAEAGKLRDSDLRYRLALAKALADAKEVPL